MDTFNFKNHKLSYIQQTKPHLDPIPHIGERTIEIPIANLYLSKMDKDKLVELGAVLPWWQIPEGREKSADKPVDYVGWPVIDIADSYSKSIRIDGCQFDYTGKHVISISTIEHFGQAGAYGIQKEERDSKGIQVLDKIIAESEKFFITWGMGQNLKLDQYADHLLELEIPKAAKYDLFMMKQINPHNRWELLETPDFSLGYNHPFQWANGVIFITNVEL